MKTRRTLAALGLAAALISSLAGAALPVQAQSPDFSLANGHFYTQTSGQAGAAADGTYAGFSVVDDFSASFWTEFQRLGGVQGVGYPVSQRFVWDGFVSQAFQRGVFQWRPEVGQAYFVNVFDQMSNAGLDGFLLTVRQVPEIADWRSDAGRPFDQVIAAHQALLDANPAIRAAYFAVPDALNLYGLPMAPISDQGNVYVLRAQRAVIQQWKEDVPWAAAGQVTVANGGDVAKEVGLLPESALSPERYQPTGNVPAGTLPTLPTIPSLPPSTPDAPPAGPVSVNPRELHLTPTVDTTSPRAGSIVALQATLTDEVGRPVQGAVIAVIGEFPGSEFAEFMPKTNASGRSSLAMPVPAGFAGQRIRVQFTAIYGELGVTEEFYLSVG